MANTTLLIIMAATTVEDAGGSSGLSRWEIVCRRRNWNITPALLVFPIADRPGRTRRPVRPGAHLPCANNSPAPGRLARAVAIR
jgi:hypothetical protein